MYLFATNARFSGGIIAANGKFSGAGRAGGRGATGCGSWILAWRTGARKSGSGVCAGCALGNPRSKPHRWWCSCSADRSSLPPLTSSPVRTHCISSLSSLPGRPPRPPLLGKVHASNSRSRPIPPIIVKASAGAEGGAGGVPASGVLCYAAPRSPDRLRG
jgi:hypothetical protein